MKSAEEHGSEAHGGHGLLAHLREGIRSGGSKPMRGSRAIRTSLRAIHLLCCGALYGGHVFDVSAERLLPALAAVLASGAFFMAYEVWRAPIWLVQLRGCATYLKLVLLASVHSFWDYRVEILSIIFVIGTVVSHMPARYRYFSLRHGRVVKGGRNG